MAKAIATGTGTAITYTLHSTPNTFFLVQVYASPAGDPSGFGEGKTLVTQRGLTTDAQGNAGETFMAGVVPVGQVITATAMSSNTSEFSNAVTVAERRTWTGGASANWSDPANWGGTAPAPRSHLVFGPGTPTTMVNDFAADTEFSSLSFTEGDYHVSGNRIKLGLGGITVSGGNTDASNEPSSNCLGHIGRRLEAPGSDQ